MHTRMPQEPRWQGDLRAALIVAAVLAALVGASSLFVRLIGP
jgi:hypothetical protein